MHRYPSLRVAYIDAREETVETEDGKKTMKFYYSVLLKGSGKLDEVRINGH